MDELITGGESKMTSMWASASVYLTRMSSAERQANDEPRAEIN